MRLNQRAENIVLPLGAVVIALLIGAVMIRLNGSNPWTAYTALLDGALGSKDDVARTLSRATPLIFTGLAVIVGLKAGLFNIGAQGQLMLGATFAAWVGYQFTGLPAVAPHPVRAGRRRDLRHAAGGARRRAQGLPGRPRGDHHDHAQRHPRQHHRVPGRRQGAVPRS